MGRLPERDVKAQQGEGRIKWRPSNVTIALIFIAIFTVGPYLAFTKRLPFTSHGYQLKATFADGVNISTKSQIRIAGVEVGEVTDVDRKGDATEVTFTVREEGRPIHDDATAQIRPRIFLEGNFFIDLNPGSPSAPEMDDGESIPVSQTSTSVQLDEIFSALQSPVRADLGRTLGALGTAFTHEPTAAEDATQLPEVQGLTGAEGINGAFLYGGPAGRYSAQVTNALLGTSPGDLSRLVAGAGRTFGALAANEEDLQQLIVNFNTFTGALAAQSRSLEATVERLAPTLRTTKTSLVSLNRTLPPLRGWAIATKPAVEALPGLIEAAEPWLSEARPLLSGRELGGIARMLREASPGLAGAAQAGKASALPETNRLSLCTTQVFVPTGNEVIDDRFSTGGPNYREFFYYLVNFAGITQNFDGNGPYVRGQLGGGATLARADNPRGQFSVDKDLWVNTVEPPIGLQPQLGGRPPQKPDVRCFQNPVPDLDGPLGQVGAPILGPVGG